MSKSGLFAHFQSRDNLQIAVLTYSAEVFRERVIQPVRQQQHQTQQEKLIALLQAWLAWNQSFAGRCMFLDAWTSAQEGEVQQAARQLVRFWLDYLARQVVQGQARGVAQRSRSLARSLSALRPLPRGSGVPRPGALRGSGPPLLAGGDRPAGQLALSRSALLFKTDKSTTVRTQKPQDHHEQQDLLQHPPLQPEQVAAGPRHPVASRTGPAHAKRTASKLLLTRSGSPGRSPRQPAWCSRPCTPEKAP